VLHCQYKFW